MAKQVTVEKLMTAEVKSCRPEDTLDRAAQIMWDNDCGSVPVVGGDGRVIGMITDRDVCMSAYTRGGRLSQLRVAEAMSRGVYACLSADPVQAAEDLMRSHQVRRLPVVDREQKLVGILSLNDLARAGALRRRGAPVKPEEVAETLAAVCAPRGSEKLAEIELQAARRRPRASGAPAAKKGARKATGGKTARPRKAASGRGGR